MNIQLNADVGEGMLNDAQLMPFLTYANIASGGHTGNENSIQQTVSLAQKYNVKVGAHPSYPDKDNFGRKSMQISLLNLEQTISKQVDLFLKVVKNLNTSMYHVKLHGALYNDVFKEEKLTHWFLNFIAKKYEGTKVFVPVGAKDYVKPNYQHMIIYEVFADRNYNDELQLVPRSYPNAVLEKPIEVLKHVQGLFLKNKLTSINGNRFKVKADTFCLHGDNPNVIAIAEIINELKKSV